MQGTTRNIILAAAGLAPAVSGLLSMEVRYTDNMIDVGNLDTFTATWETIYATEGNVQGVVTDDLYQTDQNTCQTDDKSDLSVQVKMSGAWGAEGGASSSAVRDAIVQTMWSSLEGLWEQSRYAVYEGCYGLTWQEGPLYTASAACGRLSATSCADACASAASTPELVQCDTLTWAGKVPSELRVTVYEDGKLLADELTLSFAATANDISDGGCGLVGVLAEQLAGFIPGVGSLFAAGINFKCN